MRLHFSKPPHCRTGHSQGDRYSPAWEQADQIIELYRAKDGHKTIAKRLGISPRIAREILIKRGEWKPGSLKNSQHYRDKISAIHWAKVPAWKKEEKLREEKSKKARTRKASDLPLFAAAIKKRYEYDNSRASMPIEKLMRIRADEMDNHRNNMQARMRNILRKRVNKIVKRENKSKRTAEMLGMDYAAFIAYIEAQWTEGMTWANHGRGRGKWNIDHIRPCASFDLTNSEHIAECFHHSNMRPMWAIENIRKGDMWEGKRHRVYKARRRNSHI